MMGPGSDGRQPPEEPSGPSYEPKPLGYYPVHDSPSLDWRLRRHRRRRSLNWALKLAIVTLAALLLTGLLTVCGMAITYFY